MQFITDNRGVSEVIGAILVFGLLITLMAMMQMYAVPAANEEVEFNHNQEIQSNLINFQEAASRTAAQGTTESTRVQMGTTYPTRLVFFNPTSPAGTIRTAGDEQGEIRNINSPNNDVNSYIQQGTTNSITELETKRLEYEPVYNEYQNPPTTVYEYGLMYNDFGEGQYLIEEGGNFLSGNRIDLTFFGGDLSRTSSSVTSLDSRPASAPSRTVTIEPADDDSPVVLELPTNLPAEEWDELLDDERNFLEASPAGDGMVEFELRSEGVGSYELQMAQIGIGNNVPDNEAQYLIPSDVTGTSEIGAQTNSLPFEARDRYNNPSRGESVYISVDQGSFGDEDAVDDHTIEATTDQLGQPNLQYSSDQAGVVNVMASLDTEVDHESDNPGFDPDSPRDLEFEFIIDPSQDSIDPEIDSMDVTVPSYSMCTDFDPLSDIPIIGPAVDLLGCVGTTPFSQITSTYEITEPGGSGLDHIEFRVYDDEDSDDPVFTTTHNIDGSSSSGIFHSPQINRGEHDIDEIERIEVIVHDQAGNTVTDDDFDL